MRAAPLLLFCLGLAACGAVDSLRPSVSYPAPYTAQGVTVHVEGVYQDGYGGVSAITGTARNNGPDLAMVTLYFDLLDSAGVKVASASDATAGLRAGQTWRFQAIVVSAHPVAFTRIEGGRIFVFR